VNLKVDIYKVTLIGALIDIFEILGC